MTTESIGPYLRQMRERQGLSLDEVASLTRIQPKFLSALEDEDFSVLPGQVFARGFVRTYARSLGIDEEDVLRRFSEDSSHYYQKGQEEFDLSRTKLKEEKQGKFNRNLVIVITSAILIGLAFLLPQYQDVPPSPASQAPETATLPEPSETIEPEAEKEVTVAIQETPQKETPEKEDPTPTSSTPPVSQSTIPEPQQVLDRQLTPESSSLSREQLQLEIEATQLTWVVVRSDDKDPHEALLQPGQRATWNATGHFTLTLGNAGGVVVKLNGESQGPFGRPGAVVRDIVIPR